MGAIGRRQKRGTSVLEGLDVEECYRRAAEAQRIAHGPGIRGPISSKWSGGGCL
jgi:hypothetical protein